MSAVVDLARSTYAYAPRLMAEGEAARYLGIGSTSLRENGPQPKRYGRRVLYDIKDLDRWADRLDGQPMDEDAEAKEAADIERRFLEKMRANG